MDDALVERCARAAWEAGRCSPPWGSRSQLEANRETYRRSARVVLEEAMNAGFLPPDSAARLREYVLSLDGEKAASEEWNRMHDAANELVERWEGRVKAARAAITDADLGITTDSNAWDMRNHPDSPNDLIVSPGEADAMGLNDIRRTSMVVHDGLHIVLHFSREEHRVISRLSQAAGKTPWDWARDFVVAAMEEPT